MIDWLFSCLKVTSELRLGHFVGAASLPGKLLLGYFANVGKSMYVAVFELLVI